MKQTAVEWLWKYIMQNQFHSFKEGIIAYQQAKEMEKQQVIDAYNYGQQIPPFDFAEQYFNETFNK